MLKYIKIAMIPVFMAILMIGYTLPASASTGGGGDGGSPPSTVPEPAMNLMIGGALMSLAYLVYRRNLK